MKEFGLQLWSIGKEFTSPESTLNAFQWMQKCGYTQAQTAGCYDYMPAEQFRAYADQCGIKIVGTHYDWGRIVNDIEGTVNYHKILGTDEVGIGGGYGINNMGDLKTYIANFNRLANEYAKHGMVLSYHHHSWEFSNAYKVYEGKTLFDYLVEGFDKDTTKFNLDTAWAHLAGINVPELIERLAGRVNIIHLKDVEAEHDYGNGFTGPQRIEIGKGNLNFRGIIKTAEKCGVKYFIVEDEVYTEGCPLASVRCSAKYITENLIEK